MGDRKRQHVQEGTLPSSLRPSPYFSKRPRKPDKTPPVEEWRLIPGCEGDYQASTRGRICRLKKGYKQSVLKTRINEDGYEWVCLSIDGRRMTHTVHSLVALAFHGPRPPGAVIDHRNRQRADNRPTNLCYVTPAQNNVNRCRPMESDRHTGIAGVYFHPDGGYRAVYKIGKKLFRLGRFETADEAREAFLRYRTLEFGLKFFSMTLPDLLDCLDGCAPADRQRLAEVLRRQDGALTFDLRAILDAFPKSRGPAAVLRYELLRILNEEPASRMRKVKLDAWAELFEATAGPMFEPLPLDRKPLPVTSKPVAQAPEEEWDLDDEVNVTRPAPRERAPIPVTPKPESASPAKRLPSSAPAVNDSEPQKRAPRGRRWSHFF